MTQLGKDMYGMGRYGAAMLLLALLWMHWPTHELEMARQARGFVALTGQHTLNFEVYSLTLSAAIAWSGVLSIFILYLGRSRFRSVDYQFLVTLTMVVASIYLSMLSQDLSRASSMLIKIGVAFLVPAACLAWNNRRQVILLARRLRLQNPIAMTPA